MEIQTSDRQRSQCHPGVGCTAEGSRTARTKVLAVWGQSGLLDVVRETASYHDADRALRTLLQSPPISLSKHEAAKWSWHSIVQNAIDATRDFPPVRAGMNEVDDWSEDPTDPVPETAESAPFRKKRRVKMPCGKELSPGTRPAHVLDVANATEHLNDGANLSMCRRFCTGTAFRPSAGASFGV